MHELTYLGLPKFLVISQIRIFPVYFSFSRNFKFSNFLFSHKCFNKFITYVCYKSKLFSNYTNHMSAYLFSTLSTYQVIVVNFWSILKRWMQIIVNIM